VRAASADEAVGAAWQAYEQQARRPLLLVRRLPDVDGWTDRHEYVYETSPNERRDVSADALRAGEVWTVAIYDMDEAVGEKRLAEVELIYGEFLPKGYTRETFAGMPAMRALPSFRLGDAETTKQVRIEHLICACTGMPRQDMEMIFEFGSLTPDGALERLASMQPTSAFGELFQCSNPLAAAAGYIGGHVAYPGLELGAAYDRAMQTRVFDPLGMQATTFDYARALAGNCAMPHALSLEERLTKISMDINYFAVPQRPAGAAWSSVRDMLRYVAMELAQGVLPSGERYVSEPALLARRAPQVSIGKHVTYGMGLAVDTTYGVPVVDHGGGISGFYSNMLWLPEHGVGAGVLTNGEGGWILHGQFRRKLLEVLFDGRPEADAALASQATALSETRAAMREMLSLPADPTEAAKLAGRYANAALGEVAVSQVEGATVFDFGEWWSEVGSRVSPDGTVSFVTASPGIIGLEFVVGSGAARTLTLRDAQHEYVFREP
jgi:CubicO group peptidase (beta-lactamase class C family)